MDRETRHVWEFVETLLGPVIYLVFFGLMYLASSLVCALSRGNAPMIANVQGVLTTAALVLALLSLVLIAFHMANGIRLMANGPEDAEDRFMGLVTLTLAILSALAIVWTALSAATVPLTC